MNRNEMWHLLKETGMYHIIRWHPSKKSYHSEYVLNKDTNQTDCTIITDWGYIRHVDSIHLCKNEIVVESVIGRLKINIRYKHIKKFEVQIE